MIKIGHFTYFPNFCLDQLFFLKKDFDIKDTILISGTPRSGTTWLMELLAAIPDYLTIFEPFNPNWFPQIRKSNLCCRPYLHPDKDSPDIYEYLNKVFRGKKDF